MNLAAEHKVNWRVRQKTPKFSIHTAFVARFGKIKITTLYARDIYLFILCLFRKYLLSRFMCTLRSFSVSSWNVQYFFIRSISFVTFGGRAEMLDTSDFLSSVSLDITIYRVSERATCDYLLLMYGFGFFPHFVDFLFGALGSVVFSLLFSSGTPYICIFIWNVVFAFSVQPYKHLAIWTCAHFEC